MYTFFRVSPHHDFLVFHFVFRLLFSLCLLFHLLFHLLFSSLLFSPLFFSPLFSFLLSSVIMGHTQRRNSNTCQEPGPTTMSNGMRSTNICQKPFILSCLVLSSLSSFSVFFLCLCLRVLVVCVSSCVSSCVFGCGLCGVVWHGCADSPCGVAR